MPPADSQAFLREPDKKRWTAADRLRSNLNAGVYKHAVLGLIFLKYVSNSFAERQPDIDLVFGKKPANTFTRDPHQNPRANFVIANPPFNIKEWWDGNVPWSRSEAESTSHAKFCKSRGIYGRTRQRNASFGWVQHWLHHLAPNGSMALLPANSSMSSISSGEGNIRRALIEANHVECKVALADGHAHSMETIYLN